MSFKEYFNKEIIQYTLLGLIFILIAVGDTPRTVSFFLILILSITRMIDWKYLFFIGLIAAPIKTIGMTHIGFRMHLSQIFLMGAVMGAFFDKENALRWKPGLFDVRIVAGVLVLLLSVVQSRFIPPDPIVILGAFRNYPWIKGLSRFFFVTALISLAFFIRSYASTKERFFQLVRIVILSSVVYSIIGIFAFVLYFFGFNYFGSIDLVTQTSDELQRIKVFEWEPLFYGGYLLSILPLMIVMSLKETNIFKQSHMFLFTAINTLTIILTFSRSTWIGLFFALLLIGYFYRDLLGVFAKKSYSFIKRNELFIKKQYHYSFDFGCILILIITIFAGSELESAMTKTFIKPVVDAVTPGSGKFWSTKLRLLTVEIGMKEFIKHPFLGIGFENFSFYSGNIFFHGLLGNAINYPDVGSLPLKLLFETGTLGFIVLLVIFLRSFSDIFKRIKLTKDDNLRQILKGYSACIVAFLGQSIFVSNFFSIWLWVSFGLFLAALNLSEED